MLNQQQAGMLNEMYNPKFMATVDRHGRPNLVVITSFEYYRGQIIFGNLFLWKSARNLEQNPHMAVLVIDTKLNYFIMEGRFTGFQETGELMDHLNSSEMVRYNAYTGFRSVGTMELSAVTPVQKVSPLNMLGAYLKLNLARGAVPRFPGAVAEKFSMLKSIKTVACYEDGRYTLALLPAAGVDGDYLRITRPLPQGSLYAANVITPAVVSFQVKGTVERQGLKGEQVYATGLPVTGKLIYELKT